MMRRLAPLWVLLMQPSIALGQQSGGQVGGSPLCVWQIYSTLLSYAERCRVDQGTDRRVVLEESVQHLERFIIDNSDFQQPQLDAAKAELWRKTDHPEICDPDDAVSELYQTDAASQSPAELRAWIAKYVSAPRNPADGGCL